MKLHTELTTNQIEALRLLSVVDFEILALAGDRSANLRSNILFLLTGVNRARCKAGINALVREFYALAEVPSGCLAVQEDNFREWAREAMKILNISPMAKKSS